MSYTELPFRTEHVHDWQAQGTDFSLFCRVCGVSEDLADKPIAAASFTGAKGKRCRRHQWEPVDFPHNGDWLVTRKIWSCSRCGAIRDEQRSRRGKSALMRSKREERKLAKDYQGQRTGHRGGPDDVQTGLLNVQSKAGTGWWSNRYAAELDKLPRTGGRVPALIVSNGQPGHLVRRFVVMDERDYRSLYGDRILDGDKP